MADTPRVTVPPHALEAIAFNLCSLHDFDVAFVRENDRFAKAVITEYVRTLSAAPAPEGGAVADALREMLALVLLKYGNADQAVNAAVERAQAALDTREEAPAEAGEEDGAWIIYFEDRDRELESFSGFGAREAAQRRYEQVTVSWNAHLFERVKSALPARAHPPAREDAQPVARKVAEDLIDIVDGIGGIQHGTWRDEKGARLKDTSAWAAFYVAARNNTHPAPDALRVAVEKLLPVARLNTRLGKAGDKLRSALDAVESALQAEQKGGAA